MVGNTGLAALRLFLVGTTNGEVESLAKPSFVDLARIRLCLSRTSFTGSRSEKVVTLSSLSLTSKGAP